MIESLTSPRRLPVDPAKKSADRATRCFTMAVVAVFSAIGCGRIISQKATDQLIAGDAVDRTVSQIDFRILGGKKVFLDTQFINKTVPGVGFVTSEYMVSSIRQKMMCDGCLLQEKLDEADFVVEMRIGALGADGHEVIYGVPPNNYLSIAASVVPTAPQAAAAIPSMPELSVGKKDDQMAAAKIALFAYNRRTREPIWQSGISESRSVVFDRWYLGAGPFHKGNIYGTKNRSDSGPFSSTDDDGPMKEEYFVERRFADPTKSLAETPTTPKPTTPAATATATTAAATTAAATPAAGTTPAASTAVVAPAATATAAAPSPTTSSNTPAATPVATAPAAASLSTATANVAKTATTAPDPSKGTAAAPTPATNTTAPTKTTALPSTTTLTSPAIQTNPAAGAPQTVSSASP